MHVNENGNILIGLELLRHFKCDVSKVHHLEKLLPVIQRHNDLTATLEK